MEKVAFNEKNLEYLKSLLEPEKIDAFYRVSMKAENASDEDLQIFNEIKEYLKVMEEFGENRWWKNDNEKIMAYYQFSADKLLVPWEKFERAFAKLVNHEVSILMFALSNERLKKEAEEAFKKINSK